MFKTFLERAIASITGGVIVNMLALLEVDNGLEHLSGQTKDYEISPCCFSSKNVCIIKE